MQACTASIGPLLKRLDDSAALLDVEIGESGLRDVSRLEKEGVVCRQAAEISGYTLHTD